MITVNDTKSTEKSPSLSQLLSGSQASDNESESDAFSKILESISFDKDAKKSVEINLKKSSADVDLKKESKNFSSLIILDDKTSSIKTVKEENPNISLKEKTASLLTLLHGQKNDKNTLSKVEKDEKSIIALPDGKAKVKEEDSSSVIKSLVSEDLENSKETTNTITKTFQTATSLLKGIHEDSAYIGDKVKEVLSIKEVKQLITEAKHYLKNELQKNVSQDNLSSKELPKTLGGLVKLADKVGIEVKKISVETIVQTSSEPILKNKAFKTIETEPLLKKETLNELLSKDIKIVSKEEKTFNVNKETPRLHTTSQLIDSPQKNSLNIQELTNNKKVETPSLEALLKKDFSDKKNVEVVLKDGKNVIPTVNQEKAETRLKNVNLDDITETHDIKVERKDEVKNVKQSSIGNNQDTKIELKSETPLKNVKENGIIENSEKKELSSKSDTTKIEENKLQNSSELKQSQKVQDFTARGIERGLEPIIISKEASALLQKDSKNSTFTSSLFTSSKEKSNLDKNSTIDEKIKSKNLDSKDRDAGKKLFSGALNQLLHGDNAKSSEALSSTLEGHHTSLSGSDSSLSPLKTDSLELKSTEAKQMVRHFASDLKEAVEDYKPPFTRLKMKLNPGKIGSVDLVMVQRGNNVHINISSNSAAMNILSQNIMELKQQLSNVGINNASLNVNSVLQVDTQQVNQSQNTNSSQNNSNQNTSYNGSQGGGQNSGSGQGGGQHQQGSNQGYEEQQSHDELYKNSEEELELEIILPRYI